MRRVAQPSRRHRSHDRPRDAPNGYGPGQLEVEVAPARRRPLSPAAEIRNTVASVVPDTWAGRRFAKMRRSGAIADPPPIPSSPPKAPPTRPIRRKTAARGVGGGARWRPFRLRLGGKARRRTAGTDTCSVPFHGHCPHVGIGLLAPALTFAWLRRAWRRLIRALYGDAYPH